MMSFWNQPIRFLTMQFPTNQTIHLPIICRQPRRSNLIRQSTYEHMVCFEYSTLSLKNIIFMRPKWKGWENVMNSSKPECLHKKISTSTPWNEFERWGGVWRKVASNFIRSKSLWQWKSITTTCNIKLYNCMHSYKYEVYKHVKAENSQMCKPSVVSISRD